MSEGNSSWLRNQNQLAMKTPQIKVFVDRKQGQIGNPITKEKKVEKQKRTATIKKVGQVLLWIVLGALLVYSFQTIMDLTFIANPKRIGSLSRIFKAFSKPNFGDAEFRQVVTAKMVETVQIGFLATTIGAIFALPFTLLSARPASNWGRGFNIVLQPVLSIIRSIHPLIILFFFVIVAGIGPTAGVLALTLSSTAVLIGIFAEYSQEHTSLTWPALIKVHFPGLAFKQLPVNILIATILGFVGGGGIGFVLQQSINLLNFRNASVILIACILTIGSIDLLSRAVWRQIQKKS